MEQKTASSCLKPAAEALLAVSEAMACNGLTAINGFPRPYASPLAVETPIRNPVYEPGPLPTATASNSSAFLPASDNTSSTKTAVLAAWSLPSSLSRQASTTPSRLKATEQFLVDVSIFNINAIIPDFGHSTLLKHEQAPVPGQKKTERLSRMLK